MRSVVTQYLHKLSESDKICLMDQIVHARNLYNKAIYLSRQYYFNEKGFLRYERCYSIVKNMDEYKWLNSNVAQQVLKEADGSFRAFFNLLKQAKSGRFNYHSIILPGYLSPKQHIPLISIQVRLTKDNRFIVPLSRKYKSTLRPLTIAIPPILHDKKIKRAIISLNGRTQTFKVAYEYEVDSSEWTLNHQHVLAIDFGVNNMASCVTSQGKSFIIDGHRLKARNQWFNVEYERLEQAAKRQLVRNDEGDFVPTQVPTPRMARLLDKRDSQIRDEFSKAARYIIDYCIQNDIGRVIVGIPNAVELFGGNALSLLGSNFRPVPFGMLRQSIENLCERYNITFVSVDESYTSTASFFDGDEIPGYNDDNPAPHSFSGEHPMRGLYLTKDGKQLNADINAALNILKKSDVIDITPLLEKGFVDVPKKILLP